jgi:hypothetical protein
VERSAPEPLPVGGSQRKATYEDRELNSEFCHIVGGVSSPLLSNLYMRRFILGWKRTGAEQRLGAEIVNYADDLVICCKGTNAREALGTMRRLMGQLKLTVNEEKTRTCRVPEEKFDFLGYTFGQRYAAKTKQPYRAAWPSRKSIRRMTEAVRIQTGRNREWMDADQMVKCLNQKLGGWANYFKLGPVTKAYRFLDRYTTTRLRRWLCKKHKQKGGNLSATPTNTSITRWNSFACRSFRRAFRGRRHDVQSESRMRETRLSGSMRGMWKRSRVRLPRNSCQVLNQFVRRQARPRGARVRSRAVWPGA